MMRLDTESMLQTHLALKIVVQKSARICGMVYKGLDLPTPWDLPCINKWYGSGQFNPNSVHDDDYKELI
jgi:hypothetical protein